MERGFCLWWVACGARAGRGGGGGGQLTSCKIAEKFHTQRHIAGASNGEWFPVVESLEPRNGLRILLNKVRQPELAASIVT